MFPGMNNARLKRKILIILDFENGVLPTNLPLCIEGIGSIDHSSNINVYRISTIIIFEHLFSSVASLIEKSMK